jgi:hypothetical protein
MTAQARDYWKGIFPPAYDSAGGLDEGDITQFTSPNADGTPQAIKPSGTAPWLQTFYGLMQARGTIGGSGAAAGEAVAMKRHGLARIKLAISTVMTRGAQLIADATTLGTVKPRTPYSFSAKVIGWAEEALSSSAAVQMLEAFVHPIDVEVVRPVTAGSSSTLTAATKYLAPGYVAVASAAVPLYVARFTGETIRNLGASLATAPAGTDTAIFTVQKSSDNGATWADTALTCTITGTAKAAADLTHSAVLAAGDLLALKVVSSATTAAIPFASFDIT